MIASISKYESGELKTQTPQASINSNLVQLVLVFGEKDLIQKDTYSKVKEHFPNANILLTSTAGEIVQEEVIDNSVIVAALQFSKSDVKTSSVNIKDYADSFDAAIDLSNKLPKEGLVHVLVFSDGNLVNGSELVKGFEKSIPKNVMTTGGLAGDGSNFHSTLVGINEEPIEGRIVAIGFYGDHIHITHGTQGGWDAFGLEKTVSKSINNVLYEIEGQNALDLYKKYLDYEAKNLPGSALLFPLSVTIPGTSEPVVRTILSINEDEKSMTFAGDVPVNSKVRFMKANFDKLTEAARGAANNSLKNQKGNPDFSLLISCVGRKLILGDKTSDEVQSVINTFNGKTAIAGFYSYGEISPFNDGKACQLHNQTMTITSFYEN
jgi:hypothetical protein